MDDDLRLNIFNMYELNVDGLRGDIVTNRFRAIAFSREELKSEDDIARVITCSLRHRLKDHLNKLIQVKRLFKHL